MAYRHCEVEEIIVKAQIIAQYLSFLSPVKEKKLKYLAPQDEQHVPATEGKEIELFSQTDLGTFHVREEHIVEKKPPLKLCLLARIPTW